MLPLSSSRPKKPAKGVTTIIALAHLELTLIASSDFWALGCIIYQMIAGRFAFQGLSEYLTWQKIKHLEYTFPEGFDMEAQDLIQRLLVNLYPSYPYHRRPEYFSRKVRDPAERLGVGLPGSSNDMQALRSHSFFSSINWATLWTEPPPPVGPGLVKRQHPLAQGHDQDWDDVGAAWDDLVGSDGSELEEIGWASDADAPDYERRPNGYINGNGTAVTADQLEAIGPKGEIRPMPVRRETGSTLRGLDPSSHAETAGPSRLRDSPLTGSPTSSSEGSPVEILTHRVESLHPPSTEPTVSDLPNEIEQTDEERGRNKAMSPVQGNGPSSEE
jgi:3-phosphoinositide dependent protein kinase-1